jgi:hypothetical protein
MPAVRAAAPRCTYQYEIPSEPSSAPTVRAGASAAGASAPGARRAAQLDHLLRAPRLVARPFRQDPAGHLQRRHALVVRPDPGASRGRALDLRRPRRPTSARCSSRRSASSSGCCDSAWWSRICSQGDPTVWTPSSTNTAFQRTLQEGTKLIGGRCWRPFISLVWSDARALPVPVHRLAVCLQLSLAGKDCGLISPNAR